MRSFILLSLALSTASATLTKRSPRLYARQSSDCYSTEKLCGTGCILSSYTCCPDREGGCPSTSDCEMGDNGQYGCCPKGENCSGDGGTNTQIDIPSFSFTTDSDFGVATSSYSYSSYSFDDSSFSSDLSDIAASASSVIASLSADPSFTDYLASASSALASLSTELPSATAVSGGGSSSGGDSGSGGSGGGAGVAAGGASEAGVVLPRLAAVAAAVGAVVAVVLL